jgi:hypothetical protein
MDDVQQQIALLQQRGGAQLDPIGMHQLQALARRASAHQGRVRQLLEAKLAVALGAFNDRLAGLVAQPAQGMMPCRTACPHPSLPPAGEGAAAGLSIQVPPRRTPLAELAADLAQLAAARSAGGVIESAGTAATGLRPELAATSYFRSTWSRLSIEKRVTQAIAQAPKNAGPINSHQLILRSLALMRELSPDYLNRFTTYADALLSLDQLDKKAQAASKKATVASRSRKKPSG